MLSNFFNSIADNFFTIKGRLSRKQFLLRFLIFIVSEFLFYMVGIPILGVLYALGEAEWIIMTIIVGLLSAFWGVIIGCCTVMFIISMFALQVRRLHDLNLSGWWMLIKPIPFIGWILDLMIIFKKGTEGDNNFGPPPSGKVID